MDADDYLTDLLSRIHSNEKLPHVETIRSSRDTVGYQAMQEVMALDKVELVPTIRQRLSKKKRVGELDKLRIVLGGIIENTAHPDALAAFDALMQRAPNSDNLWSSILKSARHLKIELAMPHALGFIRQESKKNLAFVAAIQYIGTMGGVEHLTEIGQLLDVDCHNRCDPMYAVLALGEIGHPDAIPYLQRAIDRHEKSRTRVSAGVGCYAEQAIERIQTLPPGVINGVKVVAWTVSPNLPERIAIGEGDGLWWIYACDSAWRVESTREAVTQEKARDIAIELAGIKQMSWHQYKPVV